jgi:hypothetical protein
VVRLLPATVAAAAAGSIAPVATVAVVAIGVLPLVNALSAARAHLVSRRGDRGRRWQDRVVVPAVFPARLLKSMLVGARVALVPLLTGVVIALAAGRGFRDSAGGADPAKVWAASATLAALWWQLVWLGRSPTYGPRFSLAIRRRPRHRWWFVAMLMAAGAAAASATIPLTAWPLTP